jgi:hypothetical protein
MALKSLLVKTSLAKASTSPIDRNRQRFDPFWRDDTSWLAWRRCPDFAGSDEQEARFGEARLLTIEGLIMLNSHEVPSIYLKMLYSI